MRDYNASAIGNDTLYDEGGSAGTHLSGDTGNDILKGGTCTLAGKTGGAYDEKKLVCVGDGFAYRKYSMGSMRKICYKKRSCLRCISLGYRLKRHARSLSVVSAGSKEAVA